MSEEKACNIRPGISYYITDGSSKIDQMYKPIKECIQNVTRNDTTLLRNVPIYLGATAGMRIVDLENQSASTVLMNRLTSDLQKDGRWAKRISVLNETEEGLYSWIATNILSGRFVENAKPGSSRMLTFGILDMGGGSEQVAHQTIINQTITTDHQQIKEIATVKLFGLRYTVSTFSNLCFGSEQILNR